MNTYCGLSPGTAPGWIMMRPRSMDRDERHAEMGNRGTHAGFRVLIGLLMFLERSGVLRRLSRRLRPVLVLHLPVAELWLRI